jgi:spermidine synthase
MKSGFCLAGSSMKPQTTLGTATTPDGNELVLYERDGIYSIRINGLELMSSRAHGSEEALASLAMAALARPRPAVLVGGLGMGYTLRAVLDHTPRGSTVVVAEVFPMVVEWNRGALADLAGRPLEDPRVRVEQADVATLIESCRASFDVVLLDVDNGPDAFTLSKNSRLYDRRGLGRAREALRRGGVLGVWSADPDPAFERRLRDAGFRVSTQRVPARTGRKGPKHTIFIAAKA